MSESQHRDGYVDPEIARAYRELADERVPATLNESVVRQASGAAGRGYARWVHWLRPAGWVVTAGLCLVVVMHVAGVPEPDTPAAALRLPGDAPLPADGVAGTARAENRGPIGQHAPGVERTREDLMLEKKSATSQSAAPLRNSKIVADETTGDSFCSADEIATPRSWLECIRRLESDDRPEAAASERERLEAAFPGFHAPGD